ncbi:hypothetical protein BHU72_07165 [Desulfuribacillus stibiiarsenatis]|uniref:histidine kinase n=1 Tax=Desulfuribacillus stibiiarsenatis TaxID=1390249 RepID=A0A1E5L4H8_9FIRM|nr:GAF domain-containing sensor histidine kinase [Desulfuribacillus stibiiarsenatis]OEH84964.1 hypothetical protein BHU72_07165 [Desulfuribacillus stibiiarsenatis]
MKLRDKISIGTISITIVMGLITMIIVRLIILDSLQNQLQAKGETVTRLVAEDIANAFLEGEILAVKRSLTDFVDNNHEIVYSYIINYQTQNTVHTFNHGFPAILPPNTRIDYNQDLNVTIYDSDYGLIRDIGYRVIKGTDIELHVGFDEQQIYSVLNRMSIIILGVIIAGILLSVMISTLVSYVITKPIGQFTEKVKNFKYGDVISNSPSSNDEIGDLENAFQEMSIRIQDNISEIEKKNKDLSMYNEIAKVISGETELDLILKASLTKLLELLDLKFGWIALLNSDQSWEFAVEVDVNKQSNDSNDNSQVKCIQTYAKLTEKDKEPRVISYQNHLMIPLIAKGKSIGVIYLMISERKDLKSGDYDILSVVGRQIGTAIENAQLWKRIKTRSLLRQELIEKTIQTQEDERLRIARELHDETSQNIAALSLGIKTVELSLTDENIKTKSLLNTLKDSISITVKGIHNIIYDLRPTLLDDKGLIPAVTWLADTKLSLKNVKAHVTVTGEEHRLSSELEISVFRIAQECITNISKYAQANIVSIRFIFTDENFMMVITDDGIGFDLESILSETSKHSRRGLGLIGMKERASLVGAKLKIFSELNKGTTLSFVVPTKIVGGYSIE